MAALGGGNVVQGALGASGGEAASAAMSDYLWSKGIDPYSPEGQSYMQTASGALGAALGSGTGAVTAQTGDAYNRVLHPEYIHRIDDAAERFAANEGISVDEARDRLIVQAYRAQDEGFDGVQIRQGKSDDLAAAAFLGNGSGYVDPRGNFIDLAGATPDERKDASVFANALYNDPRARELFMHATGLSAEYLDSNATNDYYANEMPAWGQQYADWQQRQDLRKFAELTPLGGWASAIEKTWRGDYAGGAREGGKEIAITVATAGIGKAVATAAGFLKNVSKVAAGAKGSLPEIKMVDGFYQAEGTPFKFSQYYYNRLWSTGRGAPFVQADEVLKTATTVTPDRMAGFYRYTNGSMEMDL